MAEPKRRFRVPTLVVMAALGLPALAVDFFAARGDVSPPVTLAVLVASGLVLGFLNPHRPWHAALAVGLMLPVAHLLAHAIGYQDNVSPDTYAARLLMAPVTAGAVLLGTWVGLAPRRSHLARAVPPSPD